MVWSNQQFTNDYYEYKVYRCPYVRTVFASAVVYKIKQHLRWYVLDIFPCIFVNQVDERNAEAAAEAPAADNSW